MKLPSPQDLKALRALLVTERPAWLVDNPTLERLRSTLTHAERALAELGEKRLVLGLLGGTGVGKSTLTNALAHEEISRAGDRRPTTDRIVCYRHRDFPVPEWLDEDDLAPTPPGHELPALRGVILLDLPDIDSRKRGHRDRVHRILPRLDLLLVVASVDKYADRALYEELNALPQAPKNWVFILNAIDKLSPRDRPAVVADFREKLHEHAGITNASVISLSAKQALEGDESGLAPLTAFLEELGEDAKRREVLLANAESYLVQLATQLEEAFPAAEIARWRRAFQPLEAPLDAVARSQVSAFEDDLQDAIGPWLSDRALRASSFPIGWIHFLLRRYWPGRKGGRVADPFRQASDPGHPYAEDLLLRPIRLAQHRARELAREQAERFQLSIPSTVPSEAHATGSALAEWTDHLRELAPKLGWRFRQHAIPTLLLVGTLAWVVAPVFAGQSETWLRDSWSAMWSLIARLDPISWAAVAVALGLYYLLLYPYFLHRLELRVDQEARDGAKRYVNHWKGEHATHWRTPLAAELDGWDRWWDQLGRLRKRLPAPEGSPQLTGRRA